MDNNEKWRTVIGDDGAEINVYCTGCNKEKEECKHCLWVKGNVLPDDD